MEVTPYLKLMVEKNASDLFFTTNAQVNIKIDGITSPIGKHLLAPGEVRRLAWEIMNEAQVAEFEKELEMNLSLSLSGVGRFRVNIFMQRAEVSMVIRYIKTVIPTIEELHLPDTLKEIIREPRGLVLVVGSTGSGKSTTLASMIDHRNSIMSGHILTIEDPIEFIHSHKKSVINQREVGLDTQSYGKALKNAMREAPDVILIGEIRDTDTMQTSIAYAETGHLCLSTLHSNNSYQALERILNFFNDSAHKQLLDDLSLNLRAIISQRLLKTKDGKRIPAVEILRNSPYVSELIKNGDLEKVRDTMENSNELGMVSFDQAVYKLYTEGKVELEEALNNANSRGNLETRIRLAEGLDDNTGLGDIKLDDIDDDFDSNPDNRHKLL